MLPGGAVKNLRPVLPIVLLAIPLFATDIPRGTKITVRTSTMVTSNRSLFGDPVDAVLSTNIVVNGQVIAREGDIAHGVVSAADPSRGGKFPMAGSVSIRLETVETSRGTYHLST